MSTKADLRQRVGEDLSIVPIGQPLEAQDVARIDATYAEVYARLKQKGLAVWSVDGDIPDTLMPYVALMMEQKLLITYSVPDSRYQRITTDAGPDGKTAMMMLSNASTPEYDSIDDATDF